MAQLPYSLSAYQKPPPGIPAGLWEEVGASTGLKGPALMLAVVQQYKQDEYQRIKGNGDKNSSKDPANYDSDYSGVGITLGTANFSADAINLATQSARSFFSSADSVFNGSKTSIENATKVSTAAAMAAVALEKEGPSAGAKVSDDKALQDKVAQTSKAIEELGRNDQAFAERVKQGKLFDEDHAKILKALHKGDPNYVPSQHEISKMREANFARGVDVAPAGMKAPNEAYRGHRGHLLHNAAVRDSTPAPAQKVEAGPKANKSADALANYGTQRRKLAAPGANA